MPPHNNNTPIIMFNKNNSSSSCNNYNNPQSSSLLLHHLNPKTLTVHNLVKYLVVAALLYKLLGCSYKYYYSVDSNSNIQIRSSLISSYDEHFPHHHHHHHHVAAEKQQQQGAQSGYKRKTLPSVLIIGARKCGTRALIDMLNLHPQVEKAQLEVHFFDRDENYEKGLNWYESQMPEISNDQISIEKSPSYFVTPEVPERVYGMNSTIKLLLIVREPVTRVISDYTQIYYYSNSSSSSSGVTSNNKTQQQQAPPPPAPPPPPPLSSLILHPDGSINTNYKAIRISIYSRYLQRWLDIFPTSQIHVIDGDALIRDPFTQLQEVEKFLNLGAKLRREDFYFNSTKGFYCWKKHDNGGGGTDEQHNSSSSSSSSSVHCLNDSKGRKHPNVDRRLVRKLREFYKAYNQRFYEMVGRDFGWPES